MSFSKIPITAFAALAALVALGGCATTKSGAESADGPPDEITTPTPNQRTWVVSDVDAGIDPQEFIAGDAFRTKKVGSTFRMEPIGPLADRWELKDWPEPDKEGVKLDKWPTEKVLCGTIPAGPMRGNMLRLVLVPGKKNELDFYIKKNGTCPNRDIGPGGGRAMN